jgi:hypothetical protein
MKKDVLTTGRMDFAAVWNARNELQKLESCLGAICILGRFPKGADDELADVKALLACIMEKVGELGADLNTTIETAKDVKDEVKP